MGVSGNLWIVVKDVKTLFDANNHLHSSLQNQTLNPAYFASDYFVSGNKLGQCEPKKMMKEKDYFYIIKMSRPMRI